MKGEITRRSFLGGAGSLLALSMLASVSGGSS